VNPDHALLKRVVDALKAKGADFEAAVPLTGMSREWNRAVLAEEWPTKLNRPTRARLEAYLAGASTGMEAAQVRRERETLGAGESSQPDPTFIEHVLVTAGRIQELAHQIAQMAAQQQRVGQELGKRAHTEQLRPSIGAVIAKDDQVRAAHASAPAVGKGASVHRKRQN